MKCWGLNMNKMVIVLVAIAIAMVGSGPAAGEQINVYDVGGTTPVSSLSLVQSSDVEKDLIVSAMDDIATNTNHYLTYTVTPTHTPVGETTSSTDITIQFKENSGSWGGMPYQWTQAVTSPSSESLKIRFTATTTAPEGAQYKIRVYDSLSSTSWEYEAMLTIYATALAPEFPTIALPVAAILGLAFIFQRRKDEE